MKTYLQYLLILTCLTIVSCNNDEIMEIENDQEQIVATPDCLDPSTAEPVALFLNEENWLAESLTEQRYLLFRNADLEEVIMTNCNLNSKTKSEIHQYECDGNEFAIDYDYQFLQFVSIGGNTNNFITSGATLSCVASYNEQTAQVERVTTVHLSGGSGEAAYILLDQNPDGSIELEYGSSLQAVTINNTTFLEVYLNGTSLQDSDIVANAEDGIVAIKNKNDVWYTLVDII